MRTFIFFYAPFYLKESLSLKAFVALARTATSKITQHIEASHSSECVQILATNTYTRVYKNVPGDIQLRKEKKKTKKKKKVSMAKVILGHRQRSGD